MKVSAINNYQNKYCSTKKQKSNNINFCGISTTLVLLAAKEGLSAIKSRKKVDYLYALKEHVHSNNTEKFLIGVRAMTKTPDTFYNYGNQGWAYWVSGFMDKDLTHLDELRKTCVARLNEIPDNNFLNIQAKKDLLTSCFDNGHEITIDFVNIFSSLRDSIYKSFKEEKLDTCLFSAKYNQVRHKSFWCNDNFCSSDTALPTEYEWSCNPFNLQQILDPCLSEDKKDKKEITRLTIAFDNLKLLATLNKYEHLNYLNDKQGVIQRYKQLLENYFARVINSGKRLPPNTYNEYKTSMQSL